MALRLLRDSPASRSRVRRSIHSLPWPPVSDLATLRMPTLHTDLAALANKHGPVFGLPIAEARAVVIGDAEFAEHVLSPRRAGRAFAYRWEDPVHLPFAQWGHLLGASTSNTETAGIFFGNGPHHWAPARRACERGLLHGRAVRQSGERAAAETAEALADKWARAGPQLYNVHADIREATLEVIAQVAFGAEDVLDAAARSELRSIYGDMVSCLEGLAGVPRGWWWVLRRGHSQQLKVASGRLRELLLPRLRARRGEARGAGRCIVDVLQDGGLSEGAVLHNALQILGAGHDTTATSLAMLLWHLARDAQLQDAVRREVSSAHGVGAGGCPLLAACVKEVLRLWPAAPLIVRQALEPAPMWNGVHIPAGTIAVVAPWLLGRSSAYWKEPQTFNPSRFLDAPVVQSSQGESEGEAIQRFSWMPFGYGLRSCVGQHLAVAELEAFAAAVLRRVRLGAGPAPELEWFLTLRMRGGLQLHMEPL